MPDAVGVVRAGRAQRPTGAGARVNRAAAHYDPRMSSFRPLPLLWRVTAVLIVLHVTGIAAERLFGVPRLIGPLRQVDLNAEGNLTAWFGSLLLLISAVLAAYVALGTRGTDQDLARRWVVLALLLAVMSADETAQLHDLATDPLRRVLGTELGLFHFAWVLPALVVLVLAALHLAPLARALDPAERFRLLRAAMVYVVGAVGLEMAGGLVVDRDVTEDGYTLPYLCVVTLEESFELVGAVLLVSALLGIAGRHGRDVLLAVRGGEHVEVGTVRD